MSVFHGIGLAGQALRSFQRGIEVAGHNIANVNTPGYSRQSISFKQNMPGTFYSQGSHSIGNGMSVSSINRLRDLLLEVRAHEANAATQRFAGTAAGLATIDSIYGEPSPTSISSNLNNFFNAWSSLGSNPNDASARAQVQLAGVSLADGIRDTFHTLRGEEQKTLAEIQGTFRMIDDIAARIAVLNFEIRGYHASGSPPNDLLDQRDAAVNDLSKLVDVKVQTFEDGSYAVYAANFPVVDSAGPRSFPKNYDPVASTVTTANGVVYRVRSGVLNGSFRALNETRTHMGHMNNLANTLRTQINQLHASGTTPSGETGVIFFHDSGPPQTGAIDFRVDEKILDGLNNIASSSTGAAGDGSLAFQISEMRDASIASLGNKGFVAFHKDNVVKVAHDFQYWESAHQAKAAVLQQIEAQRLSNSGVSIDDELAEMMRFQRSYQAAAKALIVFDQMTEDLIGMLRR